MSSVWTVVKREYLTRVRTRWFLISTLAVPLLMAGLIAGQVVMGQRSQRQSRTVAIIDRTGRLGEIVAGNLEGGAFTVAATYGGDADEAELRARVEDGEIGSYIVLDDETLLRGRAVLRSRTQPGTLTRFNIQQAVVRAALAERLGERAGSNETEGLAAGGSLDVLLLEEEDGVDGASRAAGIGVALAGAMILYFVILVYGIAVMRSVLEEKTSKVVEVVVSAIRPWHLMLGKLIGVGSVGLTQVAVWLGFLLLLGFLALPAVLAARPELLELQAVWDVLRGSGALFLFLGFFIGGYFLYASLYTAVGAMCSSEEEAQQAQMPVTILVVIPVILMTRMADNPETLSAVVLSLVPFFAPVLMFARAAMGAAPAWQIALSAVLIVATTIGVVWVAGRIYRVGILMQGKRPTLPELFRWIREA